MRGIHEDIVRVVFILDDGARVSVGVFPVELDVFAFADHHCVLCRASAPTVAADAGLCVETLPFLDKFPVRAAGEPRVLIKGRIVQRIPDIHTQSVVERYVVDIPAEGRKLLVVCIAVEVTFPARLEASRRRIRVDL